MVKNKVPLSTILGWFILALSFLAGCLVLTLSYEFERNNSDTSLLIILGIFTFLCLLAAATGIGLIYKKRWSRIISLLFFYISLMGWTGFVFLRIYNNGWFFGWRQILGLVGFSIFVYAIFIAGILLLNNMIVKSEFSEKEKELL